MAVISATRWDLLEPLFVAQILATVPRVPYKQPSRWKHYKQAADAASRLRRFTLRWIQGSFVPGGIFTGAPGGVVETAATLIVRTDYAGEHERLQPLIQDDWNQLRFRLAKLTQDPANGLVKLLPTSTPPLRAADTAQARTQLSDRGAASSDVLQVDLTYDLTYIQAND
jgi:hypothetical protein